ncbi:MAG: immunoglobulin domain-containing protein [Opitutaceae bacterium]
MASLLMALGGAGQLAAQSATVVLDTFGPASIGRVVPGSSWEGQVTREAEALVVAGSARDDNGWEARGLSLNASGMTALSVTGYRLADNGAGMLVIELQDAALNTAVFSAPMSAFGPVSTTVRIPLQSWAAGFDFTRLTGWAIGGGVPPPGNDAFRMVLEHLELSAQGGPTVAVLPVITVPPVDQAAPLDAEVRFIVAATGNPAPTFQWRREGRPIPGATGAVLTLTVSADTVGRYSVAVQNSVGSVLSAPVLLSVGTGSTAGLIVGGGGGGAPATGGSTGGSGGGAFTSGGANSGSGVGTGGGGAASPGGSTGGTVSGGSVAVGGSTVGSAGGADAGSLPANGTQLAGGSTGNTGGGSSVNAGAGSGTGTSGGAENTAGGTGSVAGTYFGTLPDGGSWALNVREDRRGMFLAHFPATGTAAISEVTLGADNRFQVTGTTLTPRGVVAATPGAPATASAPISYTLRAQVSADHATGDLLGYTLAAPADRGPLASAGLYRAQALYAAEGSSHVIIGPSGRVLAVTILAQTVDAVTGSLSVDGGFRAVTGQGAEVTLGLNAATRALTLGYTADAAARTMLFHGLRDTEVATAALANLSIRTLAGAEEQSLVAGFALSGGSKSVLVRGIGPALAEFGVEGVLADPRLELRRPGAEVMLAGNDDWTDAAGRVFPRVGAFALRAGSRDAALVADLEASTYTARLSEAAGGSGVALLELYDAGSVGAGRLTNLSARSMVSPDGGALIAGFNLTGTGTRRLLIRAVGPSLDALGLEGVLPDPRLDLYPAGGAVPLATNQDWSPSLAETFRQVGAFALRESSWDAAFVVTLPAGSYTAQVVSNDGASGIALVEIYELP